MLPVVSGSCREAKPRPLTTLGGIRAILMNLLTRRTDSMLYYAEPAITDGPRAGWIGGPALFDQNGRNSETLLREGASYPFGYYSYHYE